ncbi:MAG: peptidoglycan DD-metalloendopeptidase family protein [Clostridia bacterium]|nr:peptidoglycan DD-metalloendopeptidase family protein [Clostridia bacterium]
MKKTTFKKLILSLLSLSLCVTMTFAVPPNSYKANAQSVQEKLNQATKNKKEALDKINKSKDSKNQALGQKEKIDHEIDIISAELAQIDAIIADADSKIAAKQAEIEAYELQIAQSDEEFKARIRAMDEMDNSSYIDMLLNSDSLGDFLAKLETIREISEYDQGVIQNMINLKTGVENSKAEIEAARAEQQEARDLTASKRNQLQQKMNEQAALISKLDKDIAAFEKAYNEAIAQENSLKASLARSLSRSGDGTTYKGGVFAWPAPSYTYISSEYGWRIHPVLGTKKYHSGMDMAAPGGSNILAAADGTVRSAGWNGGYGYCVVIDHGGGLATLYGHSSKLLVSAGQKVTKGQVIALVGTTGMSTGNHLHFEVLLNGAATNPRNYL